MSDKRRTRAERRGSDRKVVLRHFPGAFGWRQFSVSDYSVHSGTGLELASAHTAKDAWASAAKAVATLRQKGRKS